MWVYEKKLQYPINIKQTNPKLAKIIISQYGGLYCKKIYKKPPARMYVLTGGIFIWDICHSHVFVHHHTMHPVFLRVPARCRICLV